VRAKMLQAMPELKTRARTIPQILEMADFLLKDRPFVPDAAAARVLAAVPDGMLVRLTARLRDASWAAGDLEAVVRDFAASEGLGLGKVAQPLRVALTGRTVSPGVFDMMQVLGREETLARLADCAAAAPVAP